MVRASVWRLIDEGEAGPDVWLSSHTHEHANLSAIGGLRARVYRVHSRDIVWCNPGTVGNGVTYDIVCFLYFFFQFGEGISKSRILSTYWR